METRSIVGRINPAIAAVAVIIIVLLATGFVLSDRFRTVSNLQNILEQSAPLAFVALGQTLVILAGGIDLSLDGQIALISTLAYSDGALETMDFELFEPDDLVRRARRHGLALLEACSWWDGRRPPSAEDQRYQLVLDRTTG